MSNKKNKPSQYKGSMANMLRTMGVDIPNKQMNPIFHYNPNKEKYRQIYTNFDMNQCCSRYIWKNLPNGLTSWNLERMLYFRGSVCGFYFAGWCYILPYTMNASSLNPYGIPSKVKPITYNGRAVAGKNDFFNKNFELPVDIVGNSTDKYEAVLLYDSIPYSPASHPPTRFYLNQIIINDIVDTLARVNINVVVSNKKIFLVVKDPKQAEVVRQELQMSFDSDSPFCIVNSEMEVQNVQQTFDYNADDLFNTLKNYDAIRCFMSGISSKGFGSEKRERLVTGELAGVEEEKDLVLDMGYDLRKDFADKMNAKFGTNIQVYKRSDFYKEENQTDINGNGQNIYDEMNGGDSL